MNPNKRKERSNDADRGKGAKRTKVCNTVNFLPTLFVASAMATSLA